LEKISKNVYAETKFNGCNPGFVVTSDGVVMIDTPQVPTQAVKWREIIAKYGARRPCQRKLFFQGHGDRPRRHQTSYPEDVPGRCERKI
jgi:hypothetical protein